MLTLLLLTMVAGAPPPSAAESERIIGLLRKLAPTYDVQDLIYSQKVVEYRRGNPRKAWRLVRNPYSYTARLSHNGREYWQWLKSEDDEKIRPKQWQVAEVGCRTNLFEEFEQTAFTWKGWEDVRGHHTAIFDYSIPPKQLTCKLMSRQETRSSSLSGSVYADVVSGQIWRVVLRSSPWPGEPDTATSEYEEVAIGDSRQVVCISRVEISLLPDYQARFEWTWSHFRRFQSESTIRFESPR